MTKGRFDDFRLSLIELLYKDCSPGTMGHSLVSLAREVKALRAQQVVTAEEASSTLLPHTTTR